MNTPAETSRLTIGRLARAAEVGVETIRFYEREGLLPEPARTASGYRQYPPEAVARLEFVRRAKQLGFSLAEIRELLALDRPDGDRARVKAIADHKLAEIDQRIEQLRRMRAALAELDRQCSGHGPVEGCPIIEALSGRDHGE
ncbi:MAG: MerR family DNA-binding protein [Halofilum sp. (in: g-proteobacteria)]|nr:MerR family DNA-binding protein [Halofilum sp. (in: g-proteobacteria)]